MFKSNTRLSNSNLERERQISHGNTGEWNLKYQVNLPTKQKQPHREKRPVTPRERWARERRDWELGVRRCQLVHTGQGSNTVLLNSTGRCAQYPGINHSGRGYEKQYAYAYIYIYTHRHRRRSQYAVQQRLTQHWDSTLFQFYIYT